MLENKDSRWVQKVREALEVWEVECMDSPVKKRGQEEDTNIPVFTPIAVAYGRRGGKAGHWPLKFTSNSEHLCFLGHFKCISSCARKFVLFPHDIKDS